MIKRLLQKIADWFVLFFTAFHKDRPRFYRHPDNQEDRVLDLPKYVYIMIPGKLSNETTFRKIYEDAIEISMSELDRFVKDGVQLVLFEDDPNLSGPQITMPGPEGNEMKFLASHEDAKTFIKKMEK